MRCVKIKYQLINYLRCPKFSAFQDKEKVKRLKHRITIDGLNLDKCIRVIKTDVRLCMLYRSFHNTVTISYDQCPSNLFTFQGCCYLVFEFMLAGDLQRVFELHKKRFSELQAR